MNKKKIINDPVYGFITIPSGTIFEVVNHPWFQRLTRIRQLGLTYLVYPGALHTRFHHTLGAMHLMAQAIETLRMKGQSISEETREAACLAILMHDMGHGPFSHALEELLTGHGNHEYLSEQMMQHFNTEFTGRFDEAIAIFKDKHPLKFLHQLVSSQLDVDRLDYLNRDSFFTGVSEGVISSERLIRMLDVHENHLVVEEKGIYSVEKFIVARRLMYWQVYLHKTVLAAEHMLINLINRAKELIGNGLSLFGTPDFLHFLAPRSGPLSLEKFASIDDFDVMTSIKVWSRHSDPVLAHLCRGITDRRLFKVTISNTPPDPGAIEQLRRETASTLGISFEDSAYFVFTRPVSNYAYDRDYDKINIRFKDGRVLDVAVASDNFNIDALAKPVTKYFTCSYRG